jgi:hypothetical protein
MSVNGSGLDRRTKKPLNDTTNWTVKTPDGVVQTVKKDGKVKELTGLNASDAANFVASLRRKGTWVVAVRA